MFRPNLLILCVALLAPTVELRGANPKTSNPNHNDAVVPMAVHGDEPCVELQTECQQRYEKANKGLVDIIAKNQARQLDKLKPQQFTDPYIALRQIERLSQQLRLWGEPAGEDFRFRAQSLLEPLNGIALSYAGTPAGGAFNQKARQFFQNNQKKRDHELRRIDELIQKEKWPEAEDAYFKLYDQYDLAALFIPSAERPTIFDPFGTRRMLIDRAMSALRKQTATQSLTKRRTEQVTNLDQFVQELAAAAEAVKTSGQAVIADKPLTGPELVQHFGQRWQQTLAGMVRYRGLTWALNSQESGQATMMANPNQPAVDDPVITRYHKFVAEFTNGLANLIEADAARVSEADAPALYVAYLQAVAPLAGRAFEESLTVSPFRDRLQAAVAKVAARAPALATAVATYQAATGDLLEWRRRTAAALAKSQLAAFEPLEVPFQKMATADTKSPGLIVNMVGDPALPKLFGSSPQIVPILFQRMSNKPVSVRHVTGLASGKSEMSRYSAGTYVTCRSIAGSYAPAIAALRSDLLVTDQTPPLSLAAAVAIDSAERGDAVALGGNVSGMHLEGLITRFAGLPDSAWPLETLTMSRVIMKTDSSLLPNVVQGLLAIARNCGRPFGVLQQGSAACISPVGE